jgi:hypothetical protein
MNLGRWESDKNMGRYFQGLSSNKQKTRLGAFSGARESSHALRRELHLEAERLFETKQTAPPNELFTKTEDLKNRMSQFTPWEGCARFFCPLNPYFAHSEINERIREANVIARARGGNPNSTMSEQRGREIVAGVGRGEEQAERLRGSGSTTEQVASAVVLGVPGLLTTNADYREVGRNLPEAIADRAGEIADGDICTSEQAGLPLIGKVICPGGVGCGWGCFYGNHKKKIIFIAVLVGLGVAMVALNPYMQLASKVF